MAKTDKPKKPEAPKHISFPCTKCGKDMRAPDGSLHVGINLMVNVNEGTLVPFYQKQLGKYELGKEISICWECWIDSFLKK